MTQSSTTERQQSLYAALENATLKTEHVEILFRISQEFGFGSSTLMVMPARTDRTIEGLVIESQLPKSYFAKHDQLSVASTCPIFHAARNSLIPVLWSTERIARQHDLVDKPVPPIVEFYLENGQPISVLVPLFALDGTRHLIRYDGDREPLLQKEINDLTMLTLSFFDSYEKIRCDKNHSNNGLTEREIEVVRWSATGKTSAEIGRILSLSDHTINAHMNNASKKLNCSNRTQLVAKALRMRMIS